MNSFKKIASLMAVGAISSMGLAQDGLVSPWKQANIPILPEQNKTHAFIAPYKTYQLNYNLLVNQLKSVPKQMTGRISTGCVISLPNPNGSYQRFFVAESPIMTDKLSAEIPSRTYRVEGIDDPYATGRIGFGLDGFHGFIQSPNGGGDYIIDPVDDQHHDQAFVYFRKNNFAPRNFTCFTETPVQNSAVQRFANVMSFGTLKTYKLAMYATIEYSQAVASDNFSTAQSKIVTTINRVNQVYEKDLAVHLNIVLNKPYISSDGDDGYTNDDGGAMLDENQDHCDNNPGDANYDVGHVFSTGGGGIAGLGVVGKTGSKGWGVTGLDDPQGDKFDIDYVAHEMGHQFGGPHTFNSTAWSCNGNRSSADAYEVGSGSTIMAYAGICSPEDLQPHSDAYFTFDSMSKIWAWRNNAGSHGSEVSNGNSAPTANAGSDYTVPKNTPFILSGSGSDSNGDALTYCWEQKDLGTSTNDPSQYSTGPLVRSYNPSTSNKRYVPQLATVKANSSDVWEKLVRSTDVDRDMNFRLTVRDNRSGGGNYATDDMVVHVSGAPFAVTSPNGGESKTDSATVTWDKGGTLSYSPNVNIYLSTDGGTTWPTLLLASTPNDGSQLVNFPFVTSSTCRIIVASASSIFYDMSNANFTITNVQQNTVDHVSADHTTLLGGNSTTGHVFLTDSALTNTTVNLSDDGGSVLTTPSSVIVGAGTTSTDFDIDTTAVGSTTAVTITATLGSSSKTLQMQVVPVATLQSLSISPDPIRSGGKPTGTVTISDPAPEGGVVVHLSENASDIAVPSTVTVPEGSTQGTFLITTLVIQSQTTRTVKATLNLVNKSDTITLLPFNITTITFSPTNLRGGQTGTCTVNFSDPAPQNLQLRIADNDSRTGVPNTVDVTEGATSVQFSITSVGTQTQFQVQITYKIGSNYTKVKFLNVYPPLNLSLALNPTSVKGGTTSVATATLLGKAYAGLTMTTSSSQTAYATVPASIVFSTNQSTKNFNVTTVAVSSTKTSIIRTTFGGVTKAQTLTITP